MLARTANSLFWMFCYLERAENTARLLDTGVRMALTRDVVSAEEEWRSVILTAGQQPGYEAKHASYTGMQEWNYVLRDKDNPASVLAMLGNVRSNARQSRNVITGEVWEAINDSWLQISEMLARPVGEQRVGDVLAAVRRAGTLVHGAVIGTMLRDESFHFARAGTFIELSDSIARILDMKYYLLLPSLSYVGSSLDTGQWDTVLRAVSGDRAYRWLNAGQVDARGIVEFLVLDERFPSSLSYCQTALRENLAALARMRGCEGQSNRLMRSADISLSERTIDSIFDQGLHEFLRQFMASNATIGAAISEDYRFLS